MMLCLEPRWSMLRWLLIFQDDGNVLKIDSKLDLLADWRMSTKLSKVFECTLLKLFATTRLIFLMIKFSHCGMWELLIDPCDQRRNLLFENCDWWVCPGLLSRVSNTVNRTGVRVMSRAQFWVMANLNCYLQDCYLAVQAWGDCSNLPRSGPTLVRKLPNSDPWLSERRTTAV